MESAIQTIVGVFLKSAKGKESLGGNDFQKLVKSQLHNIMMTKEALHQHSISMSKEPSSNLENAMQMLIKTFHKYSGKEGDKYTLSRGELRELLTEELGSYLGNARDGEGVEKVMNDLDANSDGEVDFTEFIILMGALTVACNDFFMEYKPEKLVHTPFEKKEATSEKKE
ncbi:protein S100-A1 isoform X2 [Oncorhynchus tshawytscha]|uniref:protein S100-A1 isoform X2 n=1 Tax=Oncorhynchus tshawytscha TaxID=74940 RepID=UPI000D0A8A2A|nr:protein S100-A1 isoform X2 [Oncorhynchus tshawytscha]